MQQASPNNLFRFMQLRPPGKANENLCLVDDTELVNDLIDLIISGRIKDLPDRAGRFLDQDEVNVGLEENYLEIKQSYDVAEDKDQFLNELVNSYRENEDERNSWQEMRYKLSDIMLAAYYSTRSVPNSFDISIAFRICELLYQILVQSKDIENVGKYFQTPLCLPNSMIDARKVYLDSEEIELIRPSGMAELMVVKQHIKRYELTEIARVENIIAGERTSQTHREFQQSEQYYFTETEATREQETSIDTADRFELSRETSQTIQEDTQLSLGLTVTGSLGPYVEFASSFELERNESKQASDSKATTYAQDIVERSVERISERVLEQRSLRIRNEREQTKLRELENDSSSHRRGVFQFIDKVFEAQVFNYGYRQMYDFILIEPSAYILQEMRSRTESPELPAPPTEPTLSPNDNILTQAITDETKFRDLLTNHAKPVQARLDIPPQREIVLSESFESTGSEGGRPMSASTKYLEIPDGYKTSSATIVGSFITDYEPEFRISIGNLKWYYKETDREVNDFRHTLTWTTPSTPIIGPVRLAIGLISWESANYTVSVTLRCELTEERKTKWKVDSYLKIYEAYVARLEEHHRNIETLKAEADAKLADGNVINENPAFKRSIQKAELKKQCLALITNNEYYTNDETFIVSSAQDGEEGDTDDPEDETANGKVEKIDINVSKVIKQGSLIRFFEHAFEWEQIQYVFYPYYWSRRDQWGEKVFSKENDAAFLEFLSSGAARVVVPVRPGFEQAVQYYMDTGLLWNGQATPPDITSPLYLSIVDEIKERTGANQGEVQVGSPWEVRVPTSLLWLRDDSQLPSWQRTSSDQWEWQSTDGSPQRSEMRITRFVLLDAETDELISELEDGGMLRLSNLEADSFVIRVETEPEAVGSVAIKFANQKVQIENEFPYTISATLQEMGTVEENRKAEYLLTATVYSGRDIAGDRKDIKTIRFTVRS